MVTLDGSIGVLLDSRFLKDFKGGISRDAREFEIVLLKTNSVKTQKFNQSSIKIEPIRSVLEVAKIAIACLQLFVPCRFSQLVRKYDFSVHFQIDAFWRSGKTRIVRVHDIFPISHPEWFDFRSKLVFRLGLRKIAKNSILICNSKSTASQVGQLLAKRRHGKSVRIYVSPCIPKGKLDWDTLPCLKCAGCRFLSLPKIRFAISVGTIEPRKNYETLISAWKNASPTNISTLLIVGRSGWKNSKTKELLDMEQEIVWIDSCCDGALAELYSACSYYISATLDEGFSLPPAEISAFAKPAVLSDIPVHREILEPNSALFYDCKDQRQLEQAIAVADDDLQSLNMLRLKGNYAPKKAREIMNRLLSEVIP